MKPQCSDCEWCDNITTTTVVKDDGYERTIEYSFLPYNVCRRFPPTVMDTWPKVRDNGWCGEFKAK